MRKASIYAMMQAYGGAENVDGYRILLLHIEVLSGPYFIQFKKTKMKI